MKLEKWSGLLKKYRLALLVVLLGVVLMLLPTGGSTAVAQSSKPAPKTSAVAAAPRSTARVAEYSVQSGETLWSISRKFNMKPMELLALNGMDQSTRVKVGDTVKVIRNN